MRRIFLSICIICLISIPLAAQDSFWNFSWFLKTSILFFPEDNGMASDPMPVLPSPGVGFSFPITDMFRLEATLDFYMTYYGFEFGRAVPVAIENRSALVLGSLLSIQVAAYFPINSFLTIRAFGGPAADLRLVLLAPDLNAGDLADAQSQTDSVRNYFWSSGRWLMPVVGAGVDFTISPRFKIGIDMRVWVPIYRIWSGEDLPAIEGWRFSPGLRFSFL